MNQITLEDLKRPIVLAWKDCTFWLIKRISPLLGRKNTYFPYKMSERPYLRRFGSKWSDKRAGRGFSRPYHVSGENKSSNTKIEKVKMSEDPSLKILNAKLKPNRTKRTFVVMSYRRGLVEELVDEHEFPTLEPHDWRSMRLPKSVIDAVQSRSEPK